MDEGSPQIEQRRGILGWILRHPKLSFTLVLLLLAAAVVLTLDQITKNHVARRHAAIKAAGEPLTVQDLIARDEPIPDDENMTVALLEHIKPFLALKIPDETQQLLPVIGLARPLGTGQPLPAEQMEAVQWYLDQLPASLHGLHEATKRPRAGFRPQWSSPVFNMVIPELSQQRQVVKVLCVDVLRAAESRDRKRAGAYLSDLYRSSHGLDSDSPFVISHLLKLAMTALCNDRLERTINQCGLEPDDIEKLKLELDRTVGIQSLTNACLVERLCIIDILGSSTSLGVAVFGSTASDFHRRIPVLRSLDEAAALDLHRDLIAATRLPESEILDAARAVEARAQSLPHYYIVARLFVPSMVRSTKLTLKTIGSTRALKAALACEQFRMKHGHWPAALEELVPEFLLSVPNDALDGKPIRYAVIPEGIKTWCIGENEQDDGGDVMRLIPPDQNQRQPDEGWVILDPDRRGVPSTQPAD